MYFFWGWCADEELSKEKGEEKRGGKVKDQERTRETDGKTKEKGDK
jgi:hypothetical protein